MKENPKDYDIFNDVEPFDISKHIAQHVTTAQRDKLQTTEAVHVGGNCWGTRCIYKEKYIYNTTIKQAQLFNYQYNIWYDVDPKIIPNPHINYSPPSYYEAYRSKIYSAKSALIKAQEVKQEEFSYLWKENSIQTRIETEEQSIQVLPETNEASTQTDLRSISPDLFEKERNINPINFISEFSDDEFNIIDESLRSSIELSGEHNPNVDYE